MLQCRLHHGKHSILDALRSFVKQPPTGLWTEYRIAVATPEVLREGGATCSDAMAENRLFWADGEAPSKADWEPIAAPTLQHTRNGVI